jgi:N-acetylglucosaminyl-diphospho-decaprenol L-rhamnosyltransferase
VRASSRSAETSAATSRDARRRAPFRASVDVVIPTHDTRDLTLRCLHAVQGAGVAGGMAVRCVLVDNASRDGTSDAVVEAFPAVDVLRMDRNAGYGEAVNLGTRSGDGEYVLILNSDAIARCDAIERLASFLSEHPDFVVAAGQLVDEETGLPQVGFAMRSFPSLAGQLALMGGLERHWPRNPISRRQSLRDFDYARTQEVSAQPAGACLMCRRSAFEAVGGFDEDFFYWFEDVDLLRRLRNLGRIGYVHDAVFDHVGAATFRQWSRPRVIVARYQGLLRYFRKHHTRAEFAALRIAIVALAAIRMLPLALVDRARARAYGRVLRMAVRAK